MQFSVIPRTPLLRGSLTPSAEDVVCVVKALLTKFPIYLNAIFLVLQNSVKVEPKCSQPNQEDNDLFFLYEFSISSCLGLRWVKI